MGRLGAFGVHPTIPHVESAARCEGVELTGERLIGKRLRLFDERAGFDGRMVRRRTTNCRFSGNWHCCRAPLIRWPKSSRGRSPKEWTPLSWKSICASPISKSCWKCPRRSSKSCPHGRKRPSRRRRACFDRWAFCSMFLASVSDSLPTDLFVF